MWCFCVIRSDKSMENALRACCKGIKIVKILIHKGDENCHQAKELKIYSLGSTSGIKASEEALNKKNHFYYTQDLSVEEMAYTSSGLQSVEERLVHYKKNKALFEEKINTLNLKVRLRDNTLVEYTKKLEKTKKERDELKLTLEKFQNSSKYLNNLLESQVSDMVKTGLGYKAASPAEESFVKSSEMLQNQENVKSRLDKGYHAVPPPYTGNYIPSKPDLMFIDEQVESESVDVVSNVTSSAVKTVESKVESVDVKNKGVYITIETKHVEKNSFSHLIIENWNSDDKSEVEFEFKVKVKTVRPCIEKIKFVKTAREKLEKVETPKQHKHYPRGNQINWNNLMSQRLGNIIDNLHNDLEDLDLRYGPYAMALNLIVADKMAHNDIAFSLRRQPRDGVEMEQFRALSIVIEGVLLHDMVDRWKWTLEGSGEFSVASARKFIDNSRLICSPKRTRWIKMVPIKVNILAWKVQFDLLSTRLNLSHRGIEI
uniref:RNA-directed DNA polymerase, eukaryota, reverse transcriptase zinc-binding domain protein n=1 Tax=Tanacetum cinerariifolium TaxID=118510 RepID=A0A699I0G7_TANCI|nr:RNA-directed DNA polymerase, eukaryota, reverse transcriptase zinc-binding domain protein [Tanacetum cinerariifolium]